MRTTLAVFCLATLVPPLLAAGVAEPAAPLKAGAEQKVYFDAVKLAKLSKTDAAAMFRKDPRWAKVTVGKDGIVLKDAAAVAADGDGKNGFRPQGVHVSIDYDHAKLLSAWVTFQERLLDPDRLLAFVGIAGAPKPTKVDDDRTKPPFAMFKTAGGVRFEWAQGFGPMKRVSAATRLPETNVPPNFVISRVDIRYVSEAVYDRWLSE